ncbi:Gtpase, partial [Globisporangium splendens]
MVAHVQDNAIFSIMPANPKKLCPAHKGAFCRASSRGLSVHVPYQFDCLGVHYGTLVIVLGSSRVGKTTLVRQLATTSKSQTAAVPPASILSLTGDYVERMAHVRSHEQLLKVHLWDTAGQGAWGSGATALPNSYFRGARGAILVFDVANRSSFMEILTTWVHHLANFHNNSESLTVALVANQTSTCKRQVSTEEGQWLAKVIQADHYFENKSTDRHFDACFDAITAHMASPTSWKISESEVASAIQRLRSPVHKPKPLPLTITTSAPSCGFHVPKLQSPTVQLVPQQYYGISPMWSPLPLGKLQSSQRRVAELFAMPVVVLLLLVLLSLLFAVWNDGDAAFGAIVVDVWSDRIGVV